MESYPSEDVEACAADAELQEQAQRELDAGMRQGLEAAREEAIAVGAGEASRWIYFQSPAWTWERECGRAGWLLYDPETGAQHAFRLIEMS